LNSGCLKHQLKIKPGCHFLKVYFSFSTISPVSRYIVAIISFNFKDIKHLITEILHISIFFVYLTKINGGKNDQ